MGTGIFMSNGGVGFTFESSRTVAILGGDSKYEQTKELKKGAEIIVATPVSWNDRFRKITPHNSYIDC